MVTETMLRSETPIGAAVQGYAVGGGLSLALAADIVLAAKDTVFYIPEVELGLPYMWGSTAMLAATMGMHRARDLTLTCERFGAEDAERLPRGLSHRALSLAHQRADSGWRCIKNIDLMLVNDLPEAR